MVRYDNAEKRLTPKEIVDRLGVGYYEMLIEEYETRIGNILAGNGDKSDECTYAADSSFKSRAEKERKVEQLRSQIKKYKEIVTEINQAINALEHSVYVLENAAATKALIDSLNVSLRECFSKYDEKDYSKRIFSDTYEEIFVNKMFHDLRTKYRRLCSKENSKVDKKTQKVSVDVYKKLKKIYNRPVISRHGGYSYDSLHHTFDQNGYDLKSFSNRLYRNIGEEYDSYDVDTLIPLGVEADKIKMAIAISNGAERTFDQYSPILDAMEYLAREYSVQQRFKTFYILRENVKNAEKLSREVECLDLIIDAFDNTSIRNTDLFKELIEIHRKQNNKLNKLTRKVDEMYSKSGMKEYIEIEQKLRNLHRNAGELRYKMSISEERFGYADPETRKLNDMYYGARAEMLSILLKYPELNRPEYGIDLTKYDKKGRQIGENSDIKRVSEMDKTSIIGEEEPFVPTVVVAENELKQKSEDIEEERKIRPLAVADDNKETENNFDIPENLVSLRTAYYSRYMVEKVKGSELGILKFSEYLESVAPDLEELIEIEKRRENRAKNVFKLYVQYLASMEDKSRAMRFSEFARIRHGLSEDDLPYEYSDDEVKKRLSL